MVKQSRTDLTGIRARQVPQTIRFLRKLGVSATRLAGIFGESPDNIRHIDNRSYKDPAPSSAPSVIDRDDLALLRLGPTERAAQVRRNLQGIRLRSKLDLAQAETIVWSIYRSHQAVGMDEGYEALVSMLPGVANARHGHPLRVRLLIEEKLAWFALALSELVPSLAHARGAMSLAVEAFREFAGVKDYLLRYSEAALVASACLQKMHQPEQAFAFIKAADEANIAAGQLPGSEHLRQRGASFLQMGSSYDDLATKALNSASQRMRRKSEARNAVDLRMTGLRQRALVTSHADWENVQQLTLDVSRVYGARSMQYQVAATFAAAVGLKVASSESLYTAVELLHGIAHTPAAQLLEITPELGLSEAQLDRWLRFALYESPSHRK